MARYLSGNFPLLEFLFMPAARPNRGKIVITNNHDFMLFESVNKELFVQLIRNIPTVHDDS
jgi:hypothetical protein